jgi:hypothetical protein
MSRQVSLLLGGLVAAALFVTVGISRADDPAPASTIAVPYSATLLDAEGEPLDSSVDVAIRVFTDAGQDAQLVYAETHDAVQVADGHLYLVIGAGASVDGTLSAESFLLYPQAEIGIEIDGEVLAGRQVLGRVPRALTADTVSAQDVRYGGEHGYVPAEAVAQNVTLAQHHVLSGDLVPKAPAGWSCEYAVEPVSPWQAVELEGGETRAEERWVTHVGGGTVDVGDGLEVTFPPQAATQGHRRVRLRRAWRECEQGCPWQDEPATGIPMRVTQMCSPELTAIPGLEESEQP